ncbi:hypothetical protein ABB05_13145 [Lederbergia galactosidilytica]|uniref:Uncharacterized protein n=1 Tax=Lederbergia galactosidilytica TaxID=217031 RepID=A0A177ZQK4_9BACI|nr:hypothetical protein ABB05_13145 [Lederbergia galactosidilytica]
MKSQNKTQDMLENMRKICFSLPEVFGLGIGSTLIFAHWLKDKPVSENLCYKINDNLVNENS